MVRFFAYFAVFFVIAFLFTGMNVLIWWAAQHGFWWAMAATAFGIAVVCGALFSIKDPAKIGAK